MKLTDRIDAQNLEIETRFFLPDLSCDILDIILETYSIERKFYLVRRGSGFLDTPSEAADHLEYITDNLYSYEEYRSAITQVRKDAKTTHVRALSQRYMLREIECQMQYKDARTQ
ncbi:hypothetical protein LMH77_12685 [Vibrio lentus]|uniref:hypothetical protein n=1 Tax=Vibrio lentus TaxID=136468 RepID=UPI001E34A6E9|nr:hypothetical protein [Vibrio lentus]MCC4783763.1 hypothetical protein [Vibrio lentus]